MPHIQLKSLLRRMKLSLWRSLPGIITGIVVALFSVLLTHGCNRYEKTQEIEARRGILCKMLGNELEFIGNQVQPYDDKNDFYRDPIRLVAPVPLLDGETLEYKAHKDLIQSLLKLQMAISKYNDLVQVTNFVQNIRRVDAIRHKQMYDTMSMLHQVVILARDEVRKHIPESCSK